MKKLDLYIFRKFLGTFVFAILLIISIAVVFDFVEKIDDFLEKGAPIKAILWNYYKNFIPYYANLFTPLFIFIAVIFFTSKMAYDSEIIAILSSGVSFRRMMYPYFLGALTIAIISYILGGYIIPSATKERLEFENKYVKARKSQALGNVHMQISPGVFAYMGSVFNSETKIGQNFTLEKFDGQILISKLTAASAKYDSIKGKWTLSNYNIREFNGDRYSTIKSGSKIDTTLNMLPSDFKLDAKYFLTMNNNELKKYINEQKSRGIGNIEEFIIEDYSRTAAPFSAFILTLIGVSLSSRKVRGGMGLHIGIGIGLSFIYIFFMQIAKSFAVGGSSNPLLAVWAPNIIFLMIGIFLYQRAPK